MPGHSAVMFPGMSCTLDGLACSRPHRGHSCSSRHRAAYTVPRPLYLFHLPRVITLEASVPLRL